MKKAIFTIILAALTATQAGAFRLFDNLTYNLRFGYSIGGTAPMGMPATIRSLDKFTLSPSFNLGLGVYRDFSEHWGVTTGLYLENKGMKVESTVKNYHMAFVRGNQRLEGNFTGGVGIDVEQWMLTLPLLATYAVNENVHIKLGPYLSYVRSHKFTGDAYGGYIRVGDPTGQKVYIGTEAGSRGTYDFSDSMRSWQFGMLAGVDWYFHRHWGVFADVSWGFTDIFDADFDTIEQNLYPIYGTIGISYRIK